MKRRYSLIMLATSLLFGGCSYFSSNQEAPEDSVEQTTTPLSEITDSEIKDRGTAKLSTVQDQAEKNWENSPKVFNSNRTKISDEISLKQENDWFSEYTELREDMKEGESISLIKLESILSEMKDVIDQIDPKGEDTIEAEEMLSKYLLVTRSMIETGDTQEIDYGFFYFLDLIATGLHYELGKLSNASE